MPPSQEQLEDDFAAFISGRGLPTSAAASLLHDTVGPLGEWVLARCRDEGASLFGISGAQGSGKSTLCAMLAWYLQQVGRRVAVLSLDDLYLTRAERQQLARDVHPLFATRGVPGTHDVQLGLSVLERLRRGTGERVHLPRFDKAQDDRALSGLWEEVTLPVDVVLFEGWCLGATPESAEALVRPCNELERVHDSDGRWRRAVNQALAGAYAELFAKLDALIFLAVPSFAHVLRWRTQQEHELRLRSARAQRVMSDEEVANFVQYFERITRHMLTTLPLCADLTLPVEEGHRLDAKRSLEASGS